MNKSSAMFPEPELTYDEIVALAAGKENTFVELKSSVFLDVDEKHPHNIPSEREKRPSERLSEMLSKELGAFANSAGGRVLFGFHDKSGLPEDFAFPKTKKNTPMEIHLSRIVHTCLQPQLLHYRVYLREDREGTHRVAVIEVLPSDHLHQSTADKHYYIRRDEHSVVGQHYQLEDIRNRGRHPRLRVERTADLPEIKGIQETLLFEQIR